jgi:hypothetical protein
MAQEELYQLPVAESLILIQAQLQAMVTGQIISVEISIGQVQVVCFFQVLILSPTMVQ